MRNTLRTVYDVMECIDEFYTSIVCYGIPKDKKWLLCYTDYISYVYQRLPLFDISRGPLKVFIFHLVLSYKDSILRSKRNVLISDEDIYTAVDKSYKFDIVDESDCITFIRNRVKISRSANMFIDNVFNGKSTYDLAIEYGISHQRISQIIDTVKEVLRDEL